MISSSFIIAYFYDISAKLRFLFGCSKEKVIYFLLCSSINTCISPKSPISFGRTNIF
ncbi:hypothetical protein PREVCOP_06222 [Segatella copri DSM 18205]|uniref:Uncharacterized protein n=1 Tax=Segatella copri DSM 18205 TaxID=537011 RepID=D1PG59_9BACT|nr:hypothetical protein PREVCOP_06222 [Segatella copri DSM 18205]